MKGQVSTELLVIVALILLVFIPLLVLVYLKASEANQQIASYQAELVVSRIVSLSNSVGSLGTSTSVTTDVYIPPNAESLTATTISGGSGGEIMLKVNTPQGVSEISDVIKYPVKNPGSIVDKSSAGATVKIRVTSEYVQNQATIKIEKVSG